MKKQYFDAAKMIFREKEGVTLIIEKDKIDETVPFTFECFQITLNIHSSLEAVGFLSTISKLLTEAGIASNCVAGYYHDHLFIKVGDEQRVMSWVSECGNVLSIYGDKMI